MFSITPDASVRYAKLRAGECGIARYPNPSDLEALRANPAIGVQENTIAFDELRVVQDRPQAVQ